MRLKLEILFRQFTQFDTEENNFRGLLENAGILGEKLFDQVLLFNIFIAQ